jgi:peroxiredoxin
MCNRMIAAVIFGSLCFSGVARRQLSGQELDRALIKKQVISEIKKNYAAFKTVVAKMETVARDPSVTERTEQTFALANGGKATIVREPMTVHTSIVTLRNDNVRSDPVGDPDGTVWTFVDGVWTQYRVKSAIAWVRKQNQMPGIFPIDPRDIGSTEIREPLLTQLHGSNVVSAQRVGGRLHLLWERAAGRGAGMQYRCEIDVQKNHLPTKIEYLDQDGKPSLTIDINYQNLIGGAWFLQEAQMLFHPSGQTMKVRILAKPQVNEPITDEAFEIEFPDGTEIRDSAHSSGYRIGGKSQLDNDAKTKVGDTVPAWSFTSVDGREFSSNGLLGRTYVITFFATWCGPCLAELRQFEDELLKRKGVERVLILAIGREHTAEELRKFVDEQKLSIPIGPDPDRKMYSQFASSKIPRTYIVGPNGMILFQSLGYAYPKYQSFVAALEKAIGELNNGSEGATKLQNRGAR